MIKWKLYNKRRRDEKYTDAVADRCGGSGLVMITGIVYQIKQCNKINSPKVDEVTEGL